jgi:hypothetical protein
MYATTLRPSISAWTFAARKCRPAQMRASTSSSRACEKLLKVRWRASVGSRSSELLVIW